MRGSLEAEIAERMGAEQASSGQRIQSLWSGYGEIRRYQLRGASHSSVVLKHVRPPPQPHPRKLRSYRVEARWYEQWSPDCDERCRLPQCYGSWSAGEELFLLLEDLDAAGYCARRGRGGAETLRVCVRWLGALHGRFLGARPEGLWPQGSYWHLDTRQEEWARMSNTWLKAQARSLDRALREAEHQTLIHGDAKLANFCFRPDGQAVAAVDFQYVGGGCGIIDLVYLLGCDREEAERSGMLAEYFDSLGDSLDASQQHKLSAIREEWTALYQVAQLDFERFLDGWR